MSLGNFGSKSVAAAKLGMLQLRIAKKKMRVEEDGVKVIVTGTGKIKSMEIKNSLKKIMILFYLDITGQDLIF